MEGTENNSPPRRLTDLEPLSKLEGVVTKVELFGAFIDIGAERQGMVHISMLKRGHVNRVEDVVKEGQKVEVWVHKVDAAAGRLELTMIKPIALKWQDIKKDLKLKGKVIRIEDFGAFVDIGAERPGLVHVSELSAEFVSNPAEVVNVGDAVEVSVIEVDRRKRQIRLSMKETMQEIVEELESEEETPTAMEFALRQALEHSNQVETHLSSVSATNETEKRKELDDILERTLEQRVGQTSTNG